MFARRQFLQLAAAMPLAPFASRNAFAQAYPSRPVRVIVSSGPGGQTDTTARLVTAKLTQNLGQSFFVENMGGAAGNMAMMTVSRAAPDGNTLLATGSSIATNISLFSKLSYDPYKDFAPISLLCSSPHLLVIHPSIPATSVNELVALAKANPGKYSYSSAGPGTPAHLAGELFKLAFGVDITHVPFKGGGPGILATLGGHTSMAVSALPTSVTYVRDGSLRALGMFSSKRASALPGVPTMAEASGQDLPADIVNGFLAPAKTPRSIIDSIHREIVKAMAAPDIRERLASMGFDAVGSTPEEFATWIKTEIPRWGKVIREAKITVD
ncbi:MAG: tripartite tricarboxylate transporter substrate binding protein [Betaproteobacteria bacterium]|nr:tripartite tricarboxylate transporter substrate binding protein [Betaproteobacteria bacterium]